MASSKERIFAWIILIIIALAAFSFTRDSIVFAADNATDNTTFNITSNETLNITTYNLTGNDTNTTITNTTNTTQEILKIPSLSIWTSGPVYVNQTLSLFANYTYSGLPILNGTCTYIEDDVAMALDTEVYYYTKTFTESGNFTYAIKCMSLGFENITKASLLQILPIIQNSTNQTQNTTNITDNDNDTYPANVDCNDFNPSINPGMQEILYNTIDDDCNSATLDYIVFSITTDKPYYNAGETVKVKINATNKSDTYITINTPTNISYVYIFSNGSYPVIQEFSLTGMSGQYGIEGINYYDTYTNQNAAAFSVQNTLNVEIQVDKDTVYEKEKIHFKAIITGNQSPVNVIWKMDDNTERYSHEFDHNYSYGRDYNVVLLATDYNGNQVMKTKKITVNKAYYLKVKVVDNSTGNIIPNATVKLNTLSKTVNSTGETEFNVTNTTYELRAYGDGYYRYADDIKINNSFYFTVKLVENLETIVPVVTLLSPANNSQHKTSEFKFKFTDNNDAACTLYISEGDGWWQETNKSSGLKSGTEYTFRYDLAEGDYLWNVLCLDTDGNIGESPDYKFNVPGTVDAVDTPDQTYNVIQDVYNIIPDFNTYSPDEKKIVEYLDMETVIKDAKRKLEMANRDLYNLKDQPNTESIIRTRDEIYARIDGIKDTTPISVTSQKKVEFVKYVDDADIEPLFTEYIGLKNIEIKNIKKLIEENKVLQKRLTIGTTAYSVLITYISGRTEEVTLVTRKFDYGSLPDDTMYVEFIPKEIVESSSNIVFITPPDKILKEDPVFETQIKKLTEFVYYFKEPVSLDVIPKIKPVAFTQTIEGTSSSITGFAILDNLGFSDSNKKVFIIEMVVVFILLGIYLFYYFRSQSNDTNLPYAPRDIKPQEQTIIPEEIKIQKITLQNNALTDTSKIGYMNSVIEKANSHIAANNLKEAALKYYEVRFLYNLLEEYDQKKMFDQVISLADEISYRHIIGMVDEAVIELAKGNKDAALVLYDSIQEEYSKLSEDYMEKAYPRCCELALHLKNGN